MSLAIETKSLTRYFDDFCAVKQVNLQVARGTLYGFLGPNGAGKSTTIKMLTGILAPTSGDVSLLGLNPWSRHEAIEIKKQIGVVPENLALFDNLTAREYLTFVGRMYLLPRDTIRSRSEELLSLLRLEDVEKKLTLEYSHGMKKKLALAAALLPNPDLLFLDEPFEGGRRADITRHPRFVGELRGPRLDRLPHFARLGDRRTDLHSRWDHRERRIG